MNAIFFYGTLRDIAVRGYVFDDTVGAEQVIDAHAKGYRTMVYPGETYPVLVPAPGAVTVGQVLLEPSDEALQRMRLFEGNEYELAALSVTAKDGQVMQVRYNRASAKNLKPREPWNYEQWQATERDHFLEATRLDMAQYWSEMNRAKTDVVRERRLRRDVIR